MTTAARRLSAGTGSAHTTALVDVPAGADLKEFQGESIHLHFFLFPVFWQKYACGF